MSKVHTTLVVGAQWGDEGKGKVVDYLTPEMDLVVRFNGGANAGHTVVRPGDNGERREFRFHLLPSGCLHPDKISVIAPGMVVDLTTLLQELKELREFGVEKPNVRISPRVHLVMPYHKLMDELEEKRRGKRGIGTTRRGIGPAYADRIARNGIRLGDLFIPDEFRAKLAFNLAEKNTLFQYLHHAEPLGEKEIYNDFLAMRDEIQPYVKDTWHLLSDAINGGKNVLFEGAQGTLLDIEFGTYPYVTSSHTISGAVGVYTGISLKKVDRVVGVCKAYNTRVGSGPFPSEMEAEVGETVRQAGKEYGATTGRPRRCGWLDLVLLRYAVRVNELNSLALSKLDVLQVLPEVQVCVAYECAGKKMEEPPEDLGRLAECKPVYRTFKGWKGIDRSTSMEDASKELRAYVDFIHKESGVPVFLMSFSPAPADTLRSNA